MTAQAPSRRSAATVAEACAQLRCGRTKLYRLISEGDLRTVTIGRRRLVMQSSIDAVFARAC